MAYSIHVHVKGNTNPSTEKKGAFVWGGYASNVSTITNNGRTILDSRSQSSTKGTDAYFRTSSKGYLSIAPHSDAGAGTDSYCIITWATFNRCSISSLLGSAVKINRYTVALPTGNAGVVLKFTANTQVCICYGTIPSNYKNGVSKYVPIYGINYTGVNDFKLGTSASSYDTVSTRVGVRYTINFYPRIALNSSDANKIKVFNVTPQSGYSPSAYNVTMKYSQNSSVARPYTDSKPFGFNEPYGRSGETTDGYGKVINPYYYGRWIELRAIPGSSTTTYTIAYNANGGSGDMDDGVKIEGETATIASCDYEYTGKVFKCWNTNSGGTGTNYYPGQSYTTNANLTLYAQWMEGWRINIAGNDVDDIAYSSEYVPLSDPIIIPTASTAQLVEPGNLYDVDSESASIDGGVRYKVTGPYTSITYYADSDPDMENPIQITLDSSGTFQVSEDGFIIISGGSSSTVVKEASDTSSYTFEGYTDVPGSINLPTEYQPGQSLSYDRVNNPEFTLYPVWERSTGANASSGYNSSTGSAFVDTKTVYYSSGVNVVQLGTSRAINGFNSLGWATSANTYEAAAPSAQNSWGYGHDGNWYAVYSRSISIQYSGNGNTSGTAPSSVSGTQYYNASGSISSLTVTLPDKGTLVRTNYEFVGWSETSTYTPGTTYPQPGDSYTFTPTVSSTSTIKVLYAVWKPTTITITYKPNRGTGTDIVDTPNIGASHKIISTTSWTRPGYKLIGWNTNSDWAPGVATGDKYYFDDQITVPSNDLTLFAVWYPLFKWTGDDTPTWTDNDSVDIDTGKPTTNATAAKWNELETKIKNYVDADYSATTTEVSKNPMIVNRFKNASNKLGVVLVDGEADKVIIASNFTAVKEALNNQATYL